MKALLTAVGMGTLSLAIVSPVAAATRVFVSARTGNDANVCASVLTPCQSLAGALVQTAAGGEIIVLDSGGYGPATITHAVTIEAPPGVLAFVHPPSGDAITINAGAADAVTLRGLTLLGGGNGILVNTVGTLIVQNCTISEFVLNGIEFEAAGQLSVQDSIVFSNPFNSGIRIAPHAGIARASLDRVRVLNNDTGFIATSILGGTVAATIRDSVISGCGFAGIIAVGFTSLPAEINVESCLVANNGRGIDSEGTVIRVSNTVVTDNTTGLIQFSSGECLSRLNNTVEGNGTDGAFTGPYAAK